MNILVVQNFELTPLGFLGECVKARGGNIDIRFPTKGDELPANSKGFDGLIILGGPMNAEDDDTYPHLKETVELIHQFQTEHKPILGVCLGAQLLARAFGSRVYSHDVVEIGFSPVFPINTAALEDPLLRNCPQKLYLMQWHFDTFDLPEAATLLMSSKACKNQVYRIGDNIYGFQFHLEVTKEILQSWIGLKNEFIENNYPDFAEQLTKQAEAHLKESMVFCRAVGDAWLDFVVARMRAMMASAQRCLEASDALML